MSAVALGVAAGLVALRCELIRDDPYTLGSISRVLPATRPAFLDALNKTRRLIGCPVDDDIEEPPPPFTGGQCPSRYRVTYTGTGPAGIQGGTTCLGEASRDGFADLWGPIGGVQTVESVCTGAFGPGTRKGISCFGFTAGARQQNPVVIQLGGVSYSNFAIASVVPLSGDPDDCGSLDPVYPDPIDKPRDVPIIFQPDFGPEINIDIPFVFAPITVNVDGSLRIPFTFDFGGFEYSGNINLPDFNVTINPPALPPGSGEDLTDQPADEPGETVDPAPAGEKIIGVVVTATTIAQNAVTEILNPGSTPTFAPRLGSVKFVYSLGGATFYSSDINIKDRRTFIECPFSQGADAVIASPAPGVELAASPIRGFALATVNDLASSTFEP